MFRYDAAKTPRRGLCTLKSTQNHPRLGGHRGGHKGGHMGVHIGRGRVPLPSVCFHAEGAASCVYQLPVDQS